MPCTAVHDARVGRRRLTWQGGGTVGREEGEVRTGSTRVQRVQRYFGLPPRTHENCRAQGGPVVAAVLLGCVWDWACRDETDQGRLGRRLGACLPLPPPVCCLSPCLRWPGGVCVCPCVCVGRPSKCLGQQEINGYRDTLGFSHRVTLPAPSFKLEASNPPLRQSSLGPLAVSGPLLVYCIQSACGTNPERFLWAS
jgi:hypothetical protein